MTIKRLRDQLRAAEEKKLDLDRLRQEHAGDFAYSLAARSWAGHIDDLTQQLAATDPAPSIELIEIRLKAEAFRSGTAPLSIAVSALNDFRLMVSYAALRLTQGGLSRRRIPQYLSSALDLRLAGLLEGSARLLVTGSAARDLFGDGIMKGALEKLFRVFDTVGAGEPFLEAVTDVGPQSARHLREFVDAVRRDAGEIDLSWRYGGETITTWAGSCEALAAVSHALAATEVNARNEVTLDGYIELLSKRERIHLRMSDNQLVRILFPKRLLPRVAELHLEQHVTLGCAVTETLNPLTGESSTYYELLTIIRAHAPTPGQG